MTEHGAKRYGVIDETTDEDDDRPAYAPDAPGSVAVAGTREETTQLIRATLSIHLAAIREEGDPLPEPSLGLWAVEMEIGIDAVLTRLLATVEPPVAR